MPQVLPPQFVFNDTTSGVFTNTKFNLAPPNSVDLAVNFVFDEILGESVVRKGTTLVGSGALNGNASPVAGLYYYSDANGINSKLLAVGNNGNNNVIYYLNAGTWTATSLTSDTAGKKTRFETFLNNVVRINGTDAVETSTDGISWSQGAALDATNFPKGKFLKVFKAQMTVAGVAGKPDSLFISSTPNAASTSISWTVGNREIVINPSDGESITALGEVGGVEIVFKDRAMYRWNNQSTEADAVVMIGCSSQESVANCGSGLLGFANQNGIYLTSGEQPIWISRRIIKWWNARDTTLDSTRASYGDELHLFTVLGNCTIDGSVFPNVVARYTINTKEWAILSFTPHAFSFFSLYINGGINQIVGGDGNNKIIQLESASLTDIGTPITFIIQSHQLTWGSRGVVKEITGRVMAYGINPANAIVQVKTDQGDWQTLGQMTNPINNLKLNQLIKGHALTFRVIGVSSGNRFRFQGLELPGITLLDYAD